MNIPDLSDPAKIAEAKAQETRFRALLTDDERAAADRIDAVNIGASSVLGFAVGRLVRDGAKPEDIAACAVGYARALRHMKESGQ